MLWYGAGHACVSCAWGTRSWQTLNVGRMDNSINDKACTFSTMQSVWASEQALLADIHNTTHTCLASIKQRQKAWN